MRAATLRALAGMAIILGAALQAEAGTIKLSPVPVPAAVPPVLWRSATRMRRVR